mmetsp:Transcript_49733/g.105902  ORF Transcript_49733/g.105902 Transcript_49733/m.105902 type:complete len:230 (+) Transcript_49733:630-1319(+)
MVEVVGLRHAVQLLQHILRITEFPHEEIRGSHDVRCILQAAELLRVRREFALEALTTLRHRQGLLVARRLAQDLCLEENHLALNVDILGPVFNLFHEVQQLRHLVGWHEVSGSMSQDHDVQQFHLGQPCSIFALLRQFERPFVSDVPLLLVFLGLVFQGQVCHFVSFLHLASHVVAKRCIEAHGRHEGAPVHLAVDSQGAPEGLCGLRPIHVGLCIGCPSSVDHQVESR